MYSLDLSSPSKCSVAEGDVFDGKADLKVTCTEEVMGKMIRKEVQPQQGKCKCYMMHGVTIGSYHTSWLFVVQLSYSTMIPTSTFIIHP